MRTKVWLSCIYSTVLILTMSFSVGQTGQTDPPLVTLQIAAPEVPVALGLKIFDAEAEFLIDLDPLVVAADPDVLTLDIYQGQRLEARRFNTQLYDGWMSWSGDLYLPDLFGPNVLAGTVLLVDHGQSVSGIIHVFATHQDFQILGSNEGEHRLILIWHQRTPSCGVQTDQLTAQSSEQVVPAAPEKLDVGFTQEIVRDPFIELTALIAPGDNSSSTTNFIQDSIALANDVMVRGQVDTVYNLLPPIELPPGSAVPAGQDVRELVKWMNTSGKTIVEQNRGSGDMIALFSNDATDFCGAANLRYKSDSGQARFNASAPSGATDGPWNAQTAYTAHIIGCGLNDFTLAHELGHNYGLRHDNDPLQSPLNPTDPNPRGFIVTTTQGLRATVMGCYVPPQPGEPPITDPFLIDCHRLGLFSDPNDLACPLFCGPAGSYELNAAAVEAVRIRAPEYANLNN